MYAGGDNWTLYETMPAAMEYKVLFEHIILGHACINFVHTQIVIQKTVYKKTITLLKIAILKRSPLKLHIMVALNSIKFC